MAGLRRSSRSDSQNPTPRCHPYTHARTHARTWASTWASTRARAPTRTYTCAHAHTRTRTHTHTLSKGWVQAIAIHAGFIGHYLDQINDKACAIPRLQHNNACRVAIGQGIPLALKRTCCFGEIDRNASRFLDSVGLYLRRRFVEIHTDFKFTSGSCAEFDILYRSSV